MSELLPDDWMERGVKALNALGHGPQEPAPATPAATPMAAWLIERPGVPGPMWASIQTKPFVQFLWTLDANKAIRYARREDAEATKTLMQDSRNLIATEHIWYDAVAMNDSASQKLPAAAQPQRESECMTIHKLADLREALDGWAEAHQRLDHSGITDCTRCKRIAEIQSRFGLAALSPQTNSQEPR